MRVDKPIFDETGEVRDCDQCPLETTRSRDRLRQLCSNWHAQRELTCPTAETYAEACALADAAKEGE